MTAPLPALGRDRVQRRVLDIIRTRPGVNREDIEVATGLKKTAITTAITDLRRLGLVRAGQPVDDGRRRRYFPVGLSPKTPTPFSRKED